MILFLMCFPPPDPLPSRRPELSPSAADVCVNGRQGFAGYALTEEQWLIILGEAGVGLKAERKQDFTFSLCNCDFFYSVIVHLCKKKPKETTWDLVLSMPKEVVASLFAGPQERQALFLAGGLERRPAWVQGAPSGAPECVLALESL